MKAQHTRKTSLREIYAIVAGALFFLLLSVEHPLFAILALALLTSAVILNPKYFGE